MTITLIPQEIKPPEAVARHEDDPRHGPHRWTREEYHKMIAAGLFDDARVELLEGEIWDMAGQLTPHATSVRKTVLALQDIFDVGYLVDSQLPVGINLWSEPEPDVVVISGTPDDFAEHHQHRRTYSFSWKSQTRLSIRTGNARLRLTRGSASQIIGSSTSSTGNLKSTASQRLKVSI